MPKSTSVRRTSKPKPSKKGFSTEEHLVSAFRHHVTRKRAQYRCTKVLAEYNYQSGRADLVGLDSSKRIHAFEAKLSKWKQALHQARRSDAFAHYAWVVMPEECGGPALESLHQFEAAGVGLILLSERGTFVAANPRENLPLLPWLTESAIERVSNA